VVKNSFLTVDVVPADEVHCLQSNVQLHLQLSNSWVSWVRGEVTRPGVHLSCNAVFGSQHRPAIAVCSTSHNRIFWYN